MCLSTTDYKVKNSILKQCDQRTDFSLDLMNSQVGI